MVDISVVIVTYNNEEEIGTCLDSILQEDSPVYEVLVIDNASRDKTLDSLDRYKDRVKIVKCEENYGYARGNNIGFEKAKGKYVFLLNPD
ncbi:MAG: glycosyltransferase, partial [Candidatus Cloacimonadota bacterium]